MKRLLIGLILLEVVFGLTLFEGFLRLLFGQPIQRELKDFPRCGRPRPIASGPRPLEDGTRKRTRKEPRKPIVPPRPVGPSWEYVDARNHETVHQCTISDKCGHGEGDCDNDGECRYPLMCGSNNCREFSPTALDWEDCCILPKTTINPTALAVIASDNHPYFQRNQTGIRSRGFPQKYENNVGRTWTVRARAGYPYISLNIHYMHLEDSQDCVFDSLRIVKNDFEEAGVFCGFLPDGYGESYYVGYGGKLQITFKSDGSETHEGFVVQINCGTSRCKIRETEYQQIPQVATGGTETESTSPTNTSTPSGVWLRGTMKSPNYPQNYINSEDWKQTLSAPGNNKIRVIFQDFCLEGNTSSTNCPYDWVNMTETNTGRTLLEKRCGCKIEIPTVDRSRTSSVTVNFHSDSSVRDRGFEFHWYEVESSAPALTTTEATTKPPTEAPTEAATEAVTEAPDPETATTAAAKYCAGSITDFNCCTLESPCNYGSGDCDLDVQCVGDLK